MNNTKMLEYTNELIDKFDIRPRNPQTLTQGMSGGNAQKIVVAREVSIGGKVLIASQPTRGVDIRGDRVNTNDIDGCKRKRTRSVACISRFGGNIFIIR